MPTNREIVASAKAKLLTTRITGYQYAQRLVDGKAAVAWDESFRLLDSVTDAAPSPSPPPPSPPPPPPPPPTGTLFDRLGAYTWGGASSTSPLATRLAKHRDWIGGQEAFALDFSAGDSWDAAMAPGWMWQPWVGQPVELISSIPLLVGGWADDATVKAELAAAARGDNDARYRQCATNLAKYRPDAIIRLAWEPNGGWYRSRGAPDPPAFVAACRRAVEQMRSVAPALRFHFSFANGWCQVPWDQLYWGDDLTDFVGPDVYDEAWGASNAAVTDPAIRWANYTYGGSYGLRDAINFAARHGKRVAIGEFSCSHRGDVPEHGGDDDPYFIDQFLGVLRQLGPQIAYAVLFDVQAGDGHHALSRVAIDGPATDNPEFALAAARYRSSVAAAPLRPAVSPLLRDLLIEPLEPPPHDHWAVQRARWQNENQEAMREATRRTLVG